MIDGLPSREFQRRGRRALARMTPLERGIFRALRFDDATYPELAERHQITVKEVETAFAGALLILAEVYDKPPPWWRRFLSS